MQGVSKLKNSNKTTLCIHWLLLGLFLSAINLNASSKFCLKLFTLNKQAFGMWWKRTLPDKIILQDLRSVKDPKRLVDPFLWLQYISTGNYFGAYISKCIHRDYDLDVKLHNVMAMECSNTMPIFSNQKTNQSPKKTNKAVVRCLTIETG